MTCPPSTLMTEPVINDPEEEHNSNNTPSNSSADPRRFNGIFLIRPFVTERAEPHLK